MVEKETSMADRLRCSFCGKDDDHVRFLVKGVSGGMICDACGFKAVLIFIKAHVTSFFKPATT
jgi:hypothetical protein